MLCIENEEIKKQKQNLKLSVREKVLNFELLFFVFSFNFLVYN